MAKMKSLKFIVYLSVHLVVNALFSRITAKGIGCKYSSSIAEHALIQHVLKERFAKSLQTCIIACEGENNCYR